MAPSTPAPPKQPPPPKLKRLPPHAHISKRPLLHPAIPSPYTSAAQKKIIYISPRTPFVSAVKRVRKLLALIDRRAVGTVDLVADARGKGPRGGGKGEGKRGGGRQTVGGTAGGEEVVLRGAGRAIEKVLGFALFFGGQADVRVRVGTGSVGVVDDVVVGERVGETGGGGGGGGGYVGMDVDVDVDMEVDRDNGKEDQEEEEELPETQIRKASYVEVAISMR